MRALMQASFDQNPEAMQALRATGNRILTHRQARNIWKEVFPSLLMDIRTRANQNYKEQPIE